MCDDGPFGFCLCCYVCISSTWLGIPGKVTEFYSLGQQEDFKSFALFFFFLVVSRSIVLCAFMGGTGRISAPDVVE